MRELREQFEKGREEYRQPRYPGDLAAEVLGVTPTRLGYATKQPKHWTFWANVGALGAVAATVAIVMWRVGPNATLVKTPVPDKTTPQYVAISPRGDEEFSVVPDLEGGSLVPQGVSVVPAGETTAGTVPAMPSFPSMSAVLDSAETTATDSNS